jgi:hypothetical protein
MQRPASVMAEERSARVEQDSTGVAWNGEALNLTPEEAKVVRESLAEIVKTHQRLDIRVMPRPKELDPRQQFEWLQR